MAGTQRASGRNFLNWSSWGGIGAIAGVVGAVATIVAVIIAIWPHGAHTTQGPSTSSVRFNSLSKITLLRYGFVFSYPSNWDQQYLPANADGAEFVNPDDRAVSIREYGPHSDLPANASIIDVEREWKFKGTVTGAVILGANGERLPAQAWRVVNQYVNGQGRSMTDMVKATYANGREVDLVMEAPTREFPRYEQAFLQLSDEMLLLAQCGECSGQ